MPMRKAKIEAKARAAGPAKAAHASNPMERPIRTGTKLHTIVKLLKRPDGCTRKQAMAAVHWPSISLHQQAAQAGLELEKRKVNGKNRYFAH